MDLAKIIKEEIKEISTEVTEWRRTFHQYPELGFQEEKTAQFIKQKLTEWGLEVKEMVQTGIVGILRGGQAKKQGQKYTTIGIRADIDALPMKELLDKSYCSKNSGKMHACGHDGHTAIALGTALVLSRLKKYLYGNIKFIFQPAEEGPGGAKPMIEAGVLRNPQVDAILALHIWSGFESGEIGVKSGVIMAATDDFEIKVKGKGTHGAHPDLGVDPVVIGSHLVLALQELVSRETDPLEPTVLTCGSFHAGSNYNIISELAEITGTIRTLVPDQRQKMQLRLKEITEGITKAMGADSEIEFHYGYPATFNDPEITDLIKEVIIETKGEEALTEYKRPSMGGEDFAYYLEKVPGMMFFLGNNNPEKGIIYPQHNPRFDIDEDILSIGIELFSQSVFKLLNQ